MSWDMRRLANAIENAATTIACAWLVITGHWVIALCAFGLMCVNDMAFAYDWMKEGSPKK